MKMIKKIKKGFTLVELVVVIAIIAILSGVSVAVYVGVTNNAKKSVLTSEASSFGNVIRTAVAGAAEGIEVEGGYTVKMANDGSLEIVYATSAASKKDAEILTLAYNNSGNTLKDGITVYEAVEETKETDKKVSELTFSDGSNTVIYSFLTGSTK